MGNITLRSFLIMSGFFLVLYLGNFFGHQWTGSHRHLLLLLSGILGTSMVLFAMGYSVKKRWRKLPGSLPWWLKSHVAWSLVGNFFIALHVGSRLHAGVPLVTYGVFLVVMISGHIGYFMYIHLRKTMSSQRKILQEQGLSPAEIEEALEAMIIGEKIMAQWRTVHFPLNITLGVALVFHILSVIYYGLMV